MSQSTIVVAQHELRGMVSVSKVKTCHQSLQVSKAIHVWPIPLLTLHKFLPMKFEDENFVVAKLTTEIINITFLDNYVYTIIIMLFRYMLAVLLEFWSCVFNQCACILYYNLL